MNNRVRYILKRDAEFIVDENKRKIPISHYNKIFVDILSTIDCDGIPDKVFIRAFFNNGEIIKGFVPSHYIDLYNKDFLFDGRFNSDK